MPVYHDIRHELTAIRTIIATLSVGTTLLGAVACAPTAAPLPQSVGRIAVLPPCDAAGAPLSRPGSQGRVDLPTDSLASLLMSAAAEELARRGLQVLEQRVVDAATGGILLFLDCGFPNTPPEEPAVHL